MSPFFKKKRKEDPPAAAAPATPEAGAPETGSPTPPTPESGTGKDGWFLPEDTRKNLLALFERFPAPVALELYTGKGVNDPYNDYLTRFLKDLDRLTPKLRISFLGLGGDQAKKRGVERSPTLLIAPDKYAIRFTGAPLGEEGRTFVSALALASTGKSGLAEVAAEVLEQLEEKRQVMVFVTPDCPYCPGQGLNAIRCAIARPDLVSAEIVEIDEHHDLAEQYNVRSVPQTTFNGEYTVLGLQPEERFVMELWALKDAEELLNEQAAGAQGPEPREVDVAIVGAGPAGLSAAIYVVRAGLSGVVLEGGIVGGQVSVTPVVENYPGFASVPGKRLMDIMGAHARQYAHISEGVTVKKITLDGERFRLGTNQGDFTARALLLTTGADYRKLGVPGEERYTGFGVSYCAACDGYLYKDKTALVVGGGSTALTDALHLWHLGVKVTIVHRRDTFRAEQHLQDSVAREGIPVLWNSEVTEVKGDGKKVTAAMIRRNDSGESRETAADAVFVAIGHVPNNELAKALGVELDAGGFVVTDRTMRTNVPRVYAAGDLTGGILQIVTAIGSGATAALSAFEDLAKPYWTVSAPEQPEEKAQDHAEQQSGA